VHEYIFAAIIGLNKSISLGRVEPLYGTCRHFLTPFYNRDSLGLSGTPSQAPATLARPEEPPYPYNDNAAKRNMIAGGVAQFHGRALKSRRTDNYQNVVKTLLRSQRLSWRMVIEPLRVM
jgi:hypothetical protein